MSDLILAIILGVAVGLLLGFQVAQDGDARDCDKLGKMVIHDTVYTCARVKGP
jgi:hypothetical protein